MTPPRLTAALRLADRHRNRRPAARRLGGVFYVALIPVLVVACTSASERTDTSSPDAPSGGSPAPGYTGTSQNSGTPFRVIIGDTTLTGHLFDNATARDLASQLPLTLTFRDLNSVEKTAPLPRKLSVDGMPAGDDPHVGELGYWAPDGDLVLYYGDVGYWTGIMRIGEFDGDMQAAADQSGDFSATIELQ